MRPLAVACIKSKYDWHEGVCDIATAASSELMDRVSFSTCMIPGIAITYGGKRMGCWSITHAPSGLLIGGDFELLDNAIRAAEKYCVGIDWYKLNGPIYSVPFDSILHNHISASSAIDQAAEDESDIISRAMAGFWD